MIMDVRFRFSSVLIAALANLIVSGLCFSENGEIAGQDTSPPSVTTEVRSETDERQLRPEVKLFDSHVEFPPLSKESIEYLFDVLRSGGAYQAPEPQLSQVAPRNVPGFWAGTRASLDSVIGPITLRFKPTDQARLDRASSKSSAVPLLDYFDVELDLALRTFTIRPSAAENKSARVGLVVKLSDSKVSPVLTEFVKGFNDTGIYFSWAPVTNSQARKAWSLMVCPRTPIYVQERGSRYTRLELKRSPYELNEVFFSVSASASARMSPGDKPERIAITLLSTSGLPRAGANRDEIKSLSPRLEVLYRPLSEFKFFKVPPLDGHTQEGLLAKIETQNAAGYIRRQYQSHVVYAHRIDEPSPVPVIIGDHRAARDEGSCYVISTQRAVWNEYDRAELPPVGGDASAEKSKNHET
jgi:hypothetical protein